MPDWSYLTVGQPILFRMPPHIGRRLVVEMLSATSRLPFGRGLIDFLGHMRPQGSKASSRTSDFAVSGPVCMHACIDPELKAVAAFERFGFGCLLIGPFHSHVDAQSSIRRDDQTQSISVPTAESSLSLSQVSERLRHKRLKDVKVIVQCHTNANARDVIDQIDHLRGCIDAVVVTPSVAVELVELGAVDSGLAVLVHVPASEAKVVALADLIERGCAGCLLDCSRRDGDAQTFSTDLLDQNAETTAWLRQQFGRDVFLLSMGGVHEPKDALRLLDAGATVVSLESGMVFGGPGLAKRINETVEAREASVQPPELAEELPVPATKSSWVWTGAMGVAMLIGGMLATLIAMTRVVLPYDESLVNMSRVELAAINDRLLDFMKHDRITLAGTMLSVGGIYTTLSWFAVRNGAHWATVTIIVSAFSGFASFFLFLGFGYFDPFHAFVTAILFQFLLMAVFSHDPTLKRATYADHDNDRAWKKSLWGQLMFIAHGATLIVAGLVICSIGISSVFVPEDLEFLCTTPEELLNANPQLVPLVAHDRATFGGMLISCGIAVLLTSLWGFRRSARWIWWMLLLGGLVAYLLTIWVHHWVGYVDLKHLLPAYGGVVAVIVGSWLTREYLTDQHPVGCEIQPSMQTMPDGGYLPQ